jgi:putative drug exporter of the RND superfamily
VSNELIEKLHVPPSTLTVVFHSATAHVSDPAYQQELNSTLSNIRAFHDVSSVTQGGVGQDGRTTYVNVGFDKDDTSMQKDVGDFRALLASSANAYPAQVYLTGQLAVEDDLNTISLQDVEQADTTVLPIALLILLVVFGTFSAAAMPLVMAIITIPLALAVIYPIASASSITTSVTSIVSIIGLGLSIDYSLFITRRFREELARGRDTREAMAWTVATAGEAIVFSGLTVMIGFSGLMLIGTGLTSVGLGGAVTVAVAVLAARPMALASDHAESRRAREQRDGVLAPAGDGRDASPGHDHRAGRHHAGRPGLACLLAHDRQPRQRGCTAARCPVAAGL